MTGDRRASSEFADEEHASLAVVVTTAEGSGGRGGCLLDRMPDPIAEETNFERRRCVDDDDGGGLMTAVGTFPVDDGGIENPCGDEYEEEDEALQPPREFTDGCIAMDDTADAFDSFPDRRPRTVYTVSGTLATGLTSDYNIASPMTTTTGLSQSQTIDSRCGFVSSSPPPSPIAHRAPFVLPQTPPSPPSSHLEHLCSKTSEPERGRTRKNRKLSGANSSSRRHRKQSKIDVRAPPPPPQKVIKTKKEKNANRRERKATKTLAIVLGRISN